MNEFFSKGSHEVTDDFKFYAASKETSAVVKYYAKEEIDSSIMIDQWNSDQKGIVSAQDVTQVYKKAEAFASEHENITDIKLITVRENVTMVEDGAFSQCTSVDKVSFLGEMESLGKNSMPPNVETVYICKHAPVLCNDNFELDTNKLYNALHEAGVAKGTEVCLINGGLVESKYQLTENDLVRTEYMKEGQWVKDNTQFALKNAMEQIQDACRELNQKESEMDCR